jgi:hypothetical protein
MQNYGVIFPDQWCKGNKTDIGTKPLKMKLKILSQCHSDDNDKFTDS